MGNTSSKEQSGGNSPRGEGEGIELGPNGMDVRAGASTKTASNKSQGQPMSIKSSSSSLSLKQRQAINKKKPWSKPTHWPTSTEPEIKEKPLRYVMVGTDSEQEWAFCDNRVKTSKYEVYTFFPKFLIEEFNPRTKVANVYFLVIAALQCITQVCI